MQIDDQLRVVPDLAESLEQPDRVTYVARLRHGVKFHNGRELTVRGRRLHVPSFLDPTFRGRSGAYRVVAAVDVARSPTRSRFTLKEPFGIVSHQPRDGHRPGGFGRANARQPVGTGPYQLARVRARRSARAQAVRPAIYGGAPANAGVVLKVVPDDTMRGLELRKGTVDLVVNDLAPDVVWQLRAKGGCRSPPAPGTDYAYIGLNLTDPVLRNPDVRKAIGYAIDRDAIVKYLRRGFASVAVGIVPPMSWAFERERLRLPLRPGGSAAAARRGRLSGSGRRRASRRASGCR